MLECVYGHLLVCVCVCVRPCDGVCPVVVCMCVSVYL